MNRREFLSSALAAAMGIAAGERKVLGQKPTPERQSTPTPELELGPKMTKEEGEVVLQHMSRKSRPRVRSAVYVEQKGSGRWTAAGTEEPNEMPGFDKFASLVGPDLPNKEAKISMYRVGPLLLGADAAAEQKLLQQQLKAKELLRESNWITYLPDSYYLEWQACELFANAYYNSKAKSVVEHVIMSPFGAITFSVNPASPLWSEYAALFEVSEQVLAEVKKFGEPILSMLGNLTVPAVRNPLNEIKTTLMSAQSAVDDALFEGDISKAEAEAQKTFLHTHISRLTTAQVNVRKNILDPLDQFHYDKSDLVERIHDKEFDTFQKLHYAVQQLYTQIDVNLSFAPAKDMLPEKK